MILADSTIRHLALREAMITPFFGESLNKNEDGTPVTSYGLTSYGYDIRLGNNFSFFRGEENKIINFIRDGKQESIFIEAKKDNVIDPNNFDKKDVVQVNDVTSIIIPPKTFFLGVSAEYMKIPRDIKVTCDNKSTCARAGIAFYVTPLEPEWEGYITLEFFNTLDSYLKLTPGMGISQLEFKQGNAPCDLSYADKKGKYNFQGSIPIPPLNKRD